MATEFTERLDTTLTPPRDPEIPAETTAQESTPGTLGSKLLKPQTLISFVFALAIMIFFFRRLDISPSEVRRDVSAANPWYFLAAIGIYYVAMVLRGIRWGWMLQAAEVAENDGVAMPKRRVLTEILMLSWFVNCLLPARLGDAYRCYVLKREAKISFSASLGTIVAERIVDLFVLVAMLVTAGLITFHGNSTPGQADQAYLAAGILVTVGAVALLGLWFGRHIIEQRIPDRWREQFVRMHDAIFACLRKPWRYVSISVVIWIMDGVRMLLVARSLGVEISFATATFVALMSSLLTTLPITPAGLGVVETAMIVVLKWVHVTPSLATSVALMDRLITYWSLIVVGLILYVRRFRSEVK
jgi:uncharacterized membrane protein YbhN (UPF0104 family)